VALLFRIEPLKFALLQEEKGMPIKGLSDQVRLARLDKIRLGIKVAGGKNAYPRPVDHFVCPEPVKKVYGEQPRELRILFPNEDDSKWASQFYRCYSQAKGLICKGDGERATALIDEQTGYLATRSSTKTSFREINCNPGACARYGKRCRRVMSAAVEACAPGSAAKRAEEDHLCPRPGHSSHPG